MGAIVGYSLLGLSVGWAHSLPLLFLSRLPIGICKQTQTVTRAIASDCTSLHNRTAAMGKLAVATGLGFIIGPALGGIMTTKDPSPPIPQDSCPSRI